MRFVEKHTRIYASFISTGIGLSIRTWRSSLYTQTLFLRVPSTKLMWLIVFVLSPPRIGMRAHSPVPKQNMTRNALAFTWCLHTTFADHHTNQFSVSLWKRGEFFLTQDKKPNHFNAARLLASSHSNSLRRAFASSISFSICSIVRIG